MIDRALGFDMHELAQKLWPINRSITGSGVRKTLKKLKEIIPELVIHSVSSGTNAFDWTIPGEWTIREALIQNEAGETIIDLKANNLHVVGYSEPVDQWLDLEELQSHLYSLPDQPDAVPYITSYYKRRWGFCLTHNQRLTLPEGKYRVLIDSEIKPGVLNYGELLIPSTVGSKKEVFLSTYICHPSMANNELSGPVVTTELSKWLLSLLKRKYNYRIVFIPETIGSIIYLSKNLEHLKRNVVAGYNITCVGDDRAYSFLPSRNGKSISDKVAQHVLKWTDQEYKRYSWIDRGSDERQYCAPGIDLPIASIMRTKYGEYPEYHTSLDDLENVVTPAGLEGGFKILKRALEAIENNCLPKIKVLGEPQLGKRGLYPTLSTKKSGEEVSLMMNIITWSDGSHDLIDIAELCNVPVWDLYPIVDKLQEHDLIFV